MAEMKRALLMLAVAVLLSACGGGGGTGEDEIAGPDLDIAGTEGTIDVVPPPDAEVVGDLGETTDFYVPPEQVDHDVDTFVPPVEVKEEKDEGGPDEIDVYVPPAGELGAKCSVAGDCKFPLCLYAATGQVCSAACDPAVPGSCPSAFRCLPFAGVEGSVCVPSMGNICRPCSTNQDCLSNGVDTGDRCVPLGAKGAFCGGDCYGGVPCPGGYECHGVVDIFGKPADQCIKVSNGAECACSDRFTTEGAWTTCYIQNLYGKCEGDRFCALTGLTACSAPTPAVELCNGQDDNCNGQIDEGSPDDDGDGIPNCNDDDDDNDNVADYADNCPTAANGGQEDFDKDGKGDACDDDMDGDGDPNTSDCAPYDPERYHGQVEACDGVDNDCEGGVPANEADGDGDSVRGCDGDCNDANGQVYPGATETCSTGYDDNCDGKDNVPDAAGCQIFYKDADGDGYGTSDTQCLCYPSAPYTAGNSDDCDDNSSDVRPGVMEDCATPTVDENCDGSFNMVGGLNCKMFYLDGDGDGYGVPESTCACEPAAPYNADNVLDCNDFEKSINPKAKEDCFTLDVDDNCNGTANDMGAANCDPWYEDKDGDGFGMGQPVCICNPQSVYTAPNGNDCNDGNKEVYPGRAESCSTTYDDNCNGEQNEADADGCIPYWVDKDGDGSAGTEICYCQPPAGSKDFPEDCCDADPLAFPGQTKYYAEPVNWCGGFDYNCDNNNEAQYNSSCVEAPCSAGWFQPAPACGVAGNWCLNCAGCGSCIGQTIPQKQKCR